MAKRRADFDDVDIYPPNKHRRIGDLVTDLNNMSAAELFNIVKEDIGYEEAANDVYGDKYRTMGVYFKLSSPDDIFQVHDNKISVLGIANCTRYIQLFHAHILHLQVDYGGADNVIVFNEILAEHCAETLTVFSFRDLSEDVIAKYSIFEDSLFDVETPFTKVHTLKIHHTNLRDSFPVISQCFPKIHNLDLYDVTGTNFAVNFGSLRRLTLGIQNADMLNVFGPLLRANPNLSQLKIEAKKDVLLDRVLNLVRNNQAIEKLIVDVPLGWYVDTHVANRLIAEHEQLLELRVENYMFYNGTISKLLEDSNLMVLMCRVTNSDAKMNLRKKHMAQWSELSPESTKVTFQRSKRPRFYNETSYRSPPPSESSESMSGPPGLGTPPRIDRTLPPLSPPKVRSPSFLATWDEMFPDLDYRKEELRWNEKKRRFFAE